MRRHIFRFTQVVYCIREPSAYTARMSERLGVTNEWADQISGLWVQFARTRFYPRVREPMSSVEHRHTKLIGYTPFHRIGLSHRRHHWYP